MSFIKHFPICSIKQAVVKMISMNNLFIFVADSLRYDFMPKRVGDAGSLIKTMAPSLNTPTSFASLITARSPENHNVRTFFDPLSPRIQTVFDAFKYGSYYDDPGDSMCKIVLRNCPKPKELTEMKEPFVWFERADETHIPYGRIKHGNFIENWRENELWGKDYVHALESGKVNAKEEYMKGVEGVKDHFLAHLDELKNMGVYERTLVIFTSDHGELLGEYGRFTHNFPPCKELVEVPTVFINMQLDVKFMRSIDILPTAFAVLGLKPLRRWDGVDVREKGVKTGVNLVEGRILTLWEWNEGNIVLKKYYKKVGNSLWMPMPIPTVMANRKLSQILHQPKLIEKIEY